MKKILKIIFTSILILILIFLIGLPQLAKKNPNILNLEKFTKEDLDVICGVELRHSDEDGMGLKYQKLWNNRNIETKYDDLRFYLFKNKKDARKYFEIAKKTTFSEVLDAGDNFVKGWEDGVIDAQVIKYYYLVDILPNLKRLGILLFNQHSTLRCKFISPYTFIVYSLIILRILLA